MSKNDSQCQHVPSEKLRYRLIGLTQHNTELEKINHGLTNERETLKKKLDDYSRLLKASTTGLISLDKSGLIDDVNSRAIDILGADKAFLLKKPINLFITPEDQAVFFVNRSRLFSGTENPPFEIKLRKRDGSIRSVRVNAYKMESSADQLPGMLLAVEDITKYRQALEALQLKEYFINLMFSIFDDLSVWSSADIDEIIIYSMEKLGLASGSDRVYVCLFHDGKTRLSITHEWLSEETESPAAKLKGATVDTFSGILRQIRKRNTIAVSNIDAITPANRSAHEGFHAIGVKSFLFTPLFYGRYLMGVIGCDAVKQQVAWSREAQNLVKCVGSAIVNALLRQKVEKAPAGTRKTVLQLVEPARKTNVENILEYEGPIEIIEEEDDISAGKKAHWIIEGGEPDDPVLLMTALLKDGKTAKITCKNCNHNKLLDISEIRAIGTRLKATCTCGETTYARIELRREHRKTVNLDGIFISGRGDQVTHQSDDWGRIKVVNLSRHGVGFKMFQKRGVSIKDRYRVKFTLDNTAESVIQKEVVVRTIANETIGCQFVGNDPCDVTIGFYMMT